MVGRLLARGMVAGILAALLSFVFAKVFGEPQVALAIAFEAAQDAAAGAAPEPEIVSRGVQASWGLLTAVLMYGAAYGGIFAIVFAFAYQRLAALSPRSMALLLAGVGFLTFVLIPDLKYPPNPPAVGQEETIGLRTEMYFAMQRIRNFFPNAVCKKRHCYTPPCSVKMTQQQELKEKPAKGRRVNIVHDPPPTPSPGG